MQDFRKFSFKEANVINCAKYISKNAYWKLYAIENIFRVIVNSILSIQVPEEDPVSWWDKYVQPDIQKKALRYMKPYENKVWHSNPGQHEIYYIDLKDLKTIMHENTVLFEPIIPNFFKWIFMIEDVVIPRNLVSHMNFPSNTDLKRIDVLYNDSLVLIELIGEKIKLTIP